MADSSKKSRRRSLGALLSSSTLTLTPSSSSHNKGQSPSVQPAPIRVPPVPDGDGHHDSEDDRPRRSLRKKSSASKLQKRSRGRSTSGSSLFRSWTGESATSAAFTMGGTTTATTTTAAAAGQQKSQGTAYYNTDLPPHLPSNNPALFEHQRPDSKKSVRNSVLGSFRSLGSAETDDRRLTWTTAKTSADEDDFLMSMVLGGAGGFQVLHYGEVQMSGGMWRRKTQFLVLTDTHLVRFKNQARAAETFPAIPSSYGRNSTSSMSAKRQSVASLASVQDGHLVGNNGEPVANNISLSNVIAVRTVHDSRSANAIEICYMEEKAVKASFLQIQVCDHQEYELWLNGIRGAAVRLNSPDPTVAFDRPSVDYVVRVLEQERDYDADSFRMFKVAQRLPVKRQQSNDDPGKNAPPPNLCFLVIGQHKIHIVPFPKPDRSSMVSLNNNSMDLSLCLGIMCLSSFSMQHGEDDFQMSFRMPLRSHFPVYLSSIFCGEIATAIWQKAEFLRPQWLVQPFIFHVPREVDDQLAATSRTDLNDGCFDRTLIAYCASYNIDTSNIRYTIDYECEDAPRFQLLPPAGSKNGSGYAALELIAVMRALRYNETFHTISFSGVKLDVLGSLRDPHEMDYDAMKTRSYASLHIPGQELLPILSQELRALSLKSTRLKRLDFSFCLSKGPGMERGADDPGCGIPEAIFPLCRRQLTNVDWIVLNGINLVDADLDYLVDAASQKCSHLRALEISHCDISIHNLNLLLSTLAAQEETLEAINISGVQGRLSPELFQQQIGYFGHIRKLNLSHVSTGNAPLIAPETLLNWRLEELGMSHMNVNEKTVQSIVAYLASPQSDRLWELRLDQCGLNGRDAAALLSAMVDEGGQPRRIHFHASENRLHRNYSDLFDAIAANKTPTHLTMRMVEFQREEHFRYLVDSLRSNVSLKYLDISKASLPYDAGQETCQALQAMFEENTTLEELDISGEYAHLEVARFGIGLNLALTGLKTNSTLKVLKIEHQKLGLQGANTLASVLEENDSLAEIHCENNELNLQSFTVLINGLQRNRAVLYLPGMDRDRELSLERVRREIAGVNEAGPGGGKSSSYSSLKGSGLRRTLQSAASGMGMGTGTRMRANSGGNKLTKQPSASAHRHSPSGDRAATPAPGPVEIPTAEARAVLRGLNKRWDEQVERLQRYLYRNYRMAAAAAAAAEAGVTNGDDGNAPNGGDMPVDSPNGGGDTDADMHWEAMSDGRPATAASLGTVLRQMAGETEDDSSWLPSSAPAPDTASTADHGDGLKEDEGLFMKTISRMSSVRTSRRDPGSTNGNSSSTTNGTSRASSRKIRPPPPPPKRTIDLGHELSSSPSSPPPPVPQFLRPDDRGVSESSVPTSTRSTGAVLTRNPVVGAAEKTEKDPTVVGGTLRNAKSSEAVAITASAEVDNGVKPNGISANGNPKQDDINDTRKADDPSALLSPVRATGPKAGGRPAAPFRALSFGLEEKLAKKKNNKRQKQRQPQDQQSYEASGSNNGAATSPGEGSRHAGTAPRLEWTLPDLKLY